MPLGPQIHHKQSTKRNANAAPLKWYEIPEPGHYAEFHVSFILFPPPSDKQSVTLHTDCGDIKLELFCEDCPRTCENFLALCASDYYNGNLFHRNIKGFIVQTGDPTGSGKGGTSIWNRKFDDEFKDNLRHNERGMVSMANGGPNTNASQFFISYAPQPHLDLKYTLFARVIDGFDALDELEKLPVNVKTYRPLIEKRLNSVTIHANPLAVV